jgi:hypothetical protein
MPNGNGTPTPPPLPPLFASGPPRDVSEQFAEKPARGRNQKESVQAFIQSKWDMLHVNRAIDPRIRDLVYDDFLQRVRHGATIPPVPGGEGYGPFYTPGFKTGFTRGTSLFWIAICPTVPGGNVTTFLFLTAMNRASFGCEALVYYDGPAEALFSVFDWSRPISDGFQRFIAFSDLGDYLREEMVLGQVRQTLPIWNSTYQIIDIEQDPKEEIANVPRWRNEVLLYNHAETSWDSIYHHDYNATVSRQRGAFQGSWGPILEVFQPYYHDTEDFGTLTTQLVGENGAGQWGGWAELTQLESNIPSCTNGFFARHLNPNFRWLVGS